MKRLHVPCQTSSQIIEQLKKVSAAGMLSQARANSVPISIVTIAARPTGTEAFGAVIAIADPALTAEVLKAVRDIVQERHPEAASLMQGTPLEFQEDRNGPGSGKTN